MNAMTLVIEICQDFINKKINLEDFQRKLNLLIIEDETDIALQKVLHSVDNKIEEILFCSLETNYYAYGLNVAKELMEELKKAR